MLVARDAMFVDEEGRSMEAEASYFFAIQVARSPFPLPPAFNCLSSRYSCLSDDIDFGDYKIKNGKLRVSDKPGFGMKLLN